MSLTSTRGGLVSTLRDDGVNNPEDFGVIYTSTLNVTAGGTYRLTTTSDDGSTIQIFDSEGNPVQFSNQTGGTLDYLNNDFHQGSTTRFGDVQLDPNETYTIQIRYWENRGADVLQGTISGPDTGGVAESLLTTDMIGPAPGPETSVTGTPAGVEGDDVIDGGAGDDYIEGNGGNDTLLGGADEDTILGGDGDDVIDGGTNTDIIDGGAGNDSITDTGGALSDDTIDGGSGDDTIDGGAREDLLTGGSGDDQIEGGAGDDTIEGGLGSDNLSGGTGNDILVGDADSATTVLYEEDFESGATGWTNPLTETDPNLGGSLGWAGSGRAMGGLRPRTPLTGFVA